MQVLFATTFFLCRILIGPCLTYWTLISPSTTGLVKVCPQVDAYSCANIRNAWSSTADTLQNVSRLEQRASRLSASSGSTGSCR